MIAIAADRQMVHVRSFQLGKDSDVSQKLLNQLAAVRVCLLNPERKAEYDARLRDSLLPDLEILEEPAEWYVQTPERQEFWPVTKAELNGWAAEGWLDADCRVLKEGWEQWKLAAEVYPALAARRIATDAEETKHTEPRHSHKTGLKNST